MLWCLDILLEESVDWKNHYGFATSLMEDKRNNEAQGPHTCQNPKWYISLVSLLLWRKIAAVQCFVLANVVRQ